MYESGASKRKIEREFQKGQKKMKKLDNFLEKARPLETATNQENMEKQNERGSGSFQEEECAINTVENTMNRSDYCIDNITKSFLMKRYSTDKGHFKEIDLTN